MEEGQTGGLMDQKENAETGQPTILTRFGQGRKVIQ